jgi:hypothetical protein
MFDCDVMSSIFAYALDCIVKHFLHIGEAIPLSENFTNETTERVSIKYNILRLPKMLTSEFDVVGIST